MFNLAGFCDHSLPLGVTLWAVGSWAQYFLATSSSSLWIVGFIIASASQAWCEDYSGHGRQRGWHMPGRALVMGTLMQPGGIREHGAAIQLFPRETDEWSLSGSLGKVFLITKALSRQTLEFQAVRRSGWACFPSSPFISYVGASKTSRPPPQNSATQARSRLPKITLFQATALALPPCQPWKVWSPLLSARATCHPCMFSHSLWKARAACPLSRMQVSRKVRLSVLKKIFFLAVLQGIWDLSSLTTDQTQVAFLGSTEC